MPEGYTNKTENEEMISYHLLALQEQLHQAYFGAGLAAAAGRAFISPKVLFFSTTPEVVMVVLLVLLGGRYLSRSAKDVCGRASVLCSLKNLIPSSPILSLYCSSSASARRSGTP